MPKQRLTVTLEAGLVEAAKRAVRDGGVDSVSAFVAASLETQLAHEERLRALDVWIADHEAEHGEITAQEMAEQRQRDRDAAAGVRARMRKSA